MQFSEKQLVDLYGDGILCQHGISTKRFYDFEAAKEFQLPSGRRCDLLYWAKNFRMFHVIEFKIVAEPSAILQAHEYREEIYDRLGLPSTTMYGYGQRGYRAGFISVVAQFFKPETLFFANHMGVECVHITPINYEMMTAKVIVPLDKKKQFESRWVRHV